MARLPARPFIPGTFHLAVPREALNLRGNTLTSLHRTGYWNGTREGKPRGRDTSGRNLQNVPPLRSGRRGPSLSRSLASNFLRGYSSHRAWSGTLRRARCDLRPLSLSLPYNLSRFFLIVPVYPGVTISLLRRIERVRLKLIRTRKTEYDPSFLFFSFMLRHFM